MNQVAPAPQEETLNTEATPVSQWSPPMFRPATWRERAGFASAAAAATFVLAVSWWLTPDPRGIGTHEQLGLAPCKMITLTGLPCPFCGMTTSFALMAEGRVVEAVVNQPAGAAAFPVAILLAALTGAGAAIGRVPARWPAPRWQMRTLLGVGAVLALSWAYKILALTIDFHR